jgi:ATP-dependent DNA helicase PIF1
VNKNKTISSQNLEKNEQYQQVFSILEKTRSHILITGRAGTGKSTLLRMIKEKLISSAVVLAPTGLAALHVGGSTIHSFFKFPPQITVEKAHEKGAQRSYDKVIRNLEYIILDEISMVRADMLDCMDMYLRAARNNSKPFGGVRMIMFGDMLQLSPIIREQEKAIFEEKYPTPYFFSSYVLGYFFKNKTGLEIVELTKIYRQKDDTFTKYLDNIRQAQHLDEALEYLNTSHIGPMGSRPEKAICLTTTNRRADFINQENLEVIEKPIFAFKGIVTGNFPDKELPTAQDLFLKEGAHVMFVKNDKEGRWMNGTLGKISLLGKTKVVVTLDAGGVVQVDPVEWEAYTAIESEAVGSYKQLPLKLAWAITIHKSQGLTFDELVLDLENGAFSEGQVYVALSRCRTKEGLYLVKKIRPSDIRVDQRVVQFYEYILNS